MSKIFHGLAGQKEIPVRKQSLKNRRIAALTTVVISTTLALQSSAATIYVSGPSTNASPLRFKAIAAGDWHSLAVQSNGTVLAWGYNGQGQTAVPSGLSGVIAVTGGDNHSLALKSDGTVVAWGDTYYSQSTVPSGLSSVVGIAAGELHSLAVKSDGTVVGWGAGEPGGPDDDNTYGQAVVPAYVTGVVAVAAGFAHNLALKSNGTVIAWGTNFYGATTVPAGLNNVVAITAGRYHSLALKSDGTIVAWGDNRLGQTSMPSGLSGVVAISANIYNSIALKSDGTVVSWGYPLNQNPVPDLSNAVAIAAGGSHGLALRADGTLAAWGDNRFGQTDLPGSSTTDHNIQDAVNAAQDGDTVLVAPGDYVVTNQIIVTKAIRLQSSNGPSQTFLTQHGALGQGTWCLAISNALAVADGFSFRPATPDPGSPGGAVLVGGTIQNCNFTNFFSSSPNGKAILMSGGIVTNVIVAYNRGISSEGVAVYCSDSGLVTDSQILATPAYNVDGGAIALVNSRLQNSVISGAPGGGNVSGPAVSALSSTVVGCTISNNFSLGKGGGAYLRDSLMDRCIVTHNTAGDSDVGAGGGGIFETNSIVRNSLIVSNHTTVSSADPNNGGLGGGVYMQGGALLNCTVSGNFVQYPPNQRGGGIFAESGGITNCIVYLNSLDIDGSSSNWFNLGPAIFDHCCTAPDPGGAGNITQDPQFVDPANGNYHLASSSPCINAGINQPWMAGAQDLDGNPRISGASVDIGAYEAPLSCVLSIIHSGPNVILRWPSADTSDLVLQQSSDLTAPEGWTPNTAPVTDNGTNKSVTIPATNNNQFFRLRSP